MKLHSSKMLVGICLQLLLFCSLAGPSQAQVQDNDHETDVEQEETIISIQVKGLERMSEDAVFTRIQTHEGDPHDPEQINNDVKSLYESGYFRDISVEVETTPQGKRLVFHVSERSLIDSIAVEGAEAVNEEDILQALESQEGQILRPDTLSRDLRSIRELYAREGYPQVEVDYSEEEVEPGRVKLVLEIEEGEQRYVQSIRIEGAQEIDPEELKDQLMLSERGYFSWLTGSGVLQEDLLERDAAAIEAYYANQGFVDVRVGQPRVESADWGARVIFQVQEGPRYRVGEVSLDGDLITEEEQLLQFIAMDDMAREEDFFDRSVLQEDMQELENFLRSHGYAFGTVRPQISKDEEEQKIRVTYVLDKEHKVYINRVEIRGNTKTRDNVIRRNLELSSGDLFDSQDLAASRRNLERLGYFESVDIETIPVAQGREMDLRVEVEDGPTGSFSVGAGYSTVNKLFFTGEIQERNFLGRGYNVSFKGTFSDRETLYQLQFWNPHVYDSALGAGIEAFDTRREYTNYDLERTGARPRFAYTLGDYTRLHWDYSLQKYTVKNVDPLASPHIQGLEGDNWSSAISTSIVRDTTDRRFFPTEGTRNVLGLEYSGGVLGGDDNFVKPSYDFTYHNQLIGDLIFSWHWEYAHLFENEEERVPDHERFYLGGIRTVRGYNYQEIASEDEEGYEVGGYKQFITNLELSYPLAKDAGLRGLIFYDAGNVWGRDERVEPSLHDSIGAGIRWHSPMGPLRLEYGYPLRDIDGDGGRVEFSVGQPF